MRHIKYLNNENDVMLLFKKYLLDNNIQNLSFKPICASGRNNSILHYTTNNKKISRNSLILMDVGCKYNNYCSISLGHFLDQVNLRKNKRYI